MNATQFVIATILVAAGGTTGAVGMALLSWSQLADSTKNLKRELEANDPDRLRKAATELLNTIGIFSAALARLKELTRIP